MMQKRDSAPLILTAAFVLLVLALNVRIFTQPIVEAGDYAANSLLVQQAKHFTLLTGHYSRWHFQHPGPAFLYLFALGEFLFHDVLHVVPAPYNGQLLITIIFNGILLCATLYVFRRHAKLSVPLALLATELVTVLVNVSGWPSMLISNWMPDVLLFPFLLFVVSAASVLTGETRHLPLMAVSGMLLIHAHFAQFLFVGVIGGVTVTYILVRAQRHSGLRFFLSERRRDFIVAAAIVFVFAVPPLLEIALDRPNNLDALLAYLHRFGGTRNNVGMAIGYFACFGERAGWYPGGWLVALLCGRLLDDVDVVVCRWLVSVHSGEAARAVPQVSDVDRGRQRRAICIMGYPNHGRILGI